MLCKVCPVKADRLGEVGKKIGQGTFGTVHEYHGSHCSASDGGRLCVKVVPLSAPQSPGRERIHEVERAELRQLLLEFRSAHVVQHHSFDNVGSSLHVVLDRCEGPDLNDHLEACGGRLPFEEVRGLAQQILGAVAAVHAAGVMHRDIKLENFRFHDRAVATLKLLDFGAAKPAPQFPQAHTVTGTLLYAAPEVFDGVYYHSCDLWSVGVVLFQLSSGMLPFDTPDVVVLRSLHQDPLLTGDCLLRGDAWRTAPPAAGRFVRGLLTVDPASRLTAAVALSHKWLVCPEGDELTAIGGEDTNLSGLSALGGAEPDNSSPNGLGRPQLGSLLRRKGSLLSDLASIAGDPPVTVGEA